MAIEKYQFGTQPIPGRYYMIWNCDTRTPGAMDHTGWTRSDERALARFKNAIMPSCALNGVRAEDTSFAVELGFAGAGIRP